MLEANPLPKRRMTKQTKTPVQVLEEALGEMGRALEEKAIELEEKRIQLEGVTQELSKTKNQLSLAETMILDLETRSAAELQRLRKFYNTKIKALRLQ